MLHYYHRCREEKRTAQSPRSAILPTRALRPLCRCASCERRRTPPLSVVIMLNVAPLRLQLLFAGISLLALTAGLPRPAAAQQTGDQQLQVACEQILAKADSNYTNGRFEAAVRLALRCLQTADPSDQQMIRAYRLLGLAYLRQDRLEDAKQVIAGLLTVAPQYEPDPVKDPPAYFSLVAIVKEERELTSEQTPNAPQEEETWISQTWNWILVTAAGAVTTGLLVLLLAGDGGPGDSGSGDLPPPPAPPN